MADVYIKYKNVKLFTSSEKGFTKITINYILRLLTTTCNLEAKMELFCFNWKLNVFSEGFSCSIFYKIRALFGYDENRIITQ
jgi:hypothetical protein